ncbi:MAG: bifunctional glutamate N-acetyltransferase/amino-acid acetyltransferase ArgJ [Actinobacteria bacterium]|nr:bifunctional glutamate N-acetyltransferase/amino-acid acetyltransferase ArgJ [Actinomycetota bacterium]MCL5883538.1 bifunctional glutamate N-acetyltransferase/amino-acid acetyltransferase ArgJ [Actinomycetota bacterium]
MHLFSSRFVERPTHVTELPGSVSTPQGFLAAGIAAGLKKSGKTDLGLLVCRQPCTSATLFTTNAAAAAPILVSRDESLTGALQGVVVNSGSANACTGMQGLKDARKMVKQAASEAGIEVKHMAVASTGVIGQALAMESIEPGIGHAADMLTEYGGGDFAEAIRTTDKIDKDGAVEVALSGGVVRIGACAKGAGMIAPNMATMLAFVTTDAVVSAHLLQDLLVRAVESSFNSMTVDGDMSTNDCIYVLASGQSGVAIDQDTGDAQLFGDALSAVCKGLALKMVADGEGATKVVELKVTGAADSGEAAIVSRAVSNSTLVRTAFYGRDANWGRIMASAGAALAGEPGLKADIHYEEVCLASGGAACEQAPDSARLKEIMSQQEISVTLDLKRGQASGTMYFSDLTHDYVTLNAEYTT